MRIYVVMTKLGYFWVHIVLCNFESNPPPGFKYSKLSWWKCFYCITCQKPDKGFQRALSKIQLFLGVNKAVFFSDHFASISRVAVCVTLLSVVFQMYAWEISDRSSLVFLHCPFYHHCFCLWTQQTAPVQIWPNQVLLVHPLGCTCHLQITWIILRKEYFPGYVPEKSMSLCFTSVVLLLKNRKDISPC